MAPRPFWKGYLKLSLVTCAVGMTPATSESDKVRFHTLNRRTGNRVLSQYVDSETGKPVRDEDEVRGYERGEGDYVLLEDDEIDSVALESTRTIDIETFAPAGDIDWVWRDQPHYLTPADEVGREAYCVIRDAMRATKTAGLSRLVLYRRERPVLLEPHENGIVLWTLRYAEEVRPAKDYFDGHEAGKPDPKLAGLVGKLIDERMTRWSPSLVKDPVQGKLLEIIAAKAKSKPAKPRSPPPARRPDNVIDIMDALRKSLAEETKASRKK